MLSGDDFGRVDEFLEPGGQERRNNRVGHTGGEIFSHGSVKSGNVWRRG